MVGVVVIRVADFVDETPERRLNRFDPSLKLCSYFGVVE